MDIRTLALVLGVATLLQVVALYAHYVVSGNRPGQRWWTMGMACLAAGYLFGLMRNVSGFGGLSALAINLCMMGGLLFLYVGIRRFFGKNDRYWLLVFLAGFLGAGFFTTIFLVDALALRRVMLSVVVALASLLAARSLLVDAPPALRGSARFLAIVFLINCLFFVVRSLSVLWEPVLDAFDASPVQVATYLVTLCTSTLWTSGFIIMANQRLLVENKEGVERLGVIFNTSPDAVMITRLSDGKIVEVNESLVEMSGYRRDEALGRTAIDLQIWPDAAGRQAYLDALAANGVSENVEMTLTRKDGSQFVALVSSRITRLDGEPHLLSVARDISERRQYEDALQASVSLLNAALESTADGLLVVDLVGRITRHNQKCIDMWGIPDSVLATGKEKDFLDHVAGCLNEPGLITGLAANLHDHPEESGNDLLLLSYGQIYELYTQPQRIGEKIVGRVWSFRDVTAQKQAEERLLNYANQMEYKNLELDVTLSIAKGSKAQADTAAEAAARASAAKSEFLANMSHEIRTPLNGVIGFTELLRNTPLNSIQKQYVDNANTAGHSLLSIINDILDFSKIEAGKLDLEIIRSDVVEILGHTADIMKYQTAQKGLELLLDIPPDLPRMMDVDPVRLRQVLVNLLGNAVKFSLQGEVELKVSFRTLEEGRGLLGFSVRDTGIGISPEQQGKLFKAFSQADSSTSRKFGGTGLGLAISSLLVEKMGGHIQLESELERGSVFSFELPAGFDPDSVSAGGSLTLDGKVLVVDDNENQRKILARDLAWWGLEAETTDSGLAAVQLLAKGARFAAILVDQHMPYLSGLETIRMIRDKLPEAINGRSVILMLDSADDSAVLAGTRELGLDHILSKPVKMNDLREILAGKPASPVPGQSGGAVMDDQVPAKDQDGRSRLILVAEDVPMNMRLITIMLAQIIPGVRIREALNGQSALEMALQEKPDLVLLDVQMPLMSGIEVAQRIREHERLQGGHIPLIALTAGVVKGEEERCYGAGMDGFVSKPIDREALRLALKKHLGGGPEPDLVHFDRATLLMRAGNNQNLYEELLAMAKDQFEEYLAALETALQAGDDEAIRRSAHTLRGAAMTMCFNRLADEVRNFEQRHALGDGTATAVFFGPIRGEWQALLGLLYQ